mmetsp:Transcript_11264/g.22265  ORF Transcript_11264/g.22265 Transcript_11264/m.22265 type:complete len:152 (+) Transcript_11264:233-688(+)
MISIFSKGSGCARAAMKILFAACIIGTFLFSSCDAFGLVNKNSSVQTTTTTTGQQIVRETTGETFLQSRQNFFAAATAAIGASTAAAVLFSPEAAWAKDEDFVKGSKNDPAVQAKLSVCMYECTKPKGDEQKSRAQCLKECKAEFITARAS